MCWDSWEKLTQTIDRESVKTSWAWRSLDLFFFPAANVYSNKYVVPAATKRVCLANFIFISESPPPKKKGGFGRSSVVRTLKLKQISSYHPIHASLVPWQLCHPFTCEDINTQTLWPKPSEKTTSHDPLWHMNFHLRQETLIKVHLQILQATQSNSLSDSSGEGVQYLNNHQFQFKQKLLNQDQEFATLFGKDRCFQTMDGCHLCFPKHTIFTSVLEC